MEKNGLYYNLVNAQMKQENDKDSEADSLESDEEMEMYKLDDKKKNMESTLATPSTSQTIKRQISIKVKRCILNYTYM